MKILIAGASGGIGSYIAEFFSSDNDVFGTYKSRKPGPDVAYHMQQLDVTNELAVENWIRSSCSDIDDLALIYCVGVNYNCMMHRSEGDRWIEVIESNLIGIRHILRYLLPIMRKRGFGRVILLSSVVPKIGVPGTSAYSASKAAMWGLSTAVAKENAKYGITINTINLGYFDIGMINDVPQEKLDAIISSIPIGRLGDPKNILATIDYLIKTDYSTGSQIDLNGGMG